LKKFFKWFGYLLLGLIVIIIASVLFLLNSTKTIEWAADKYAPQYGFGYKQISGGLLSGLKIDGLTFKDDKVLDRFTIGWNPAPLLHKKVSVTHLSATELDIDTIQKIVKAFSSDKPKKEDNSTFVMPVSIGLGELHLTVKPFDESGVHFREISVNGSDLAYSGEKVDADQIKLWVDTDVATAELIAGSNDKVVRVKSISIMDIDSIKLESIVKTLKEKKAHEEVVEQVDKSADQHKKGNDNLLPESILIDSIVVMVKPSERPEISITRAELKSTSVEIGIHDVIDQKPNAVQIESLSLNVDTNLSTLALQARLEGDSVIVDSLSLREVNTLALTKLLATAETNTTDANTTKPAEEKYVDSKDSNDTSPLDNPLIPNYLIVKHLDSSILSATYDPVLVKSAEVNASDVKFNIHKLLAESGEIDINIASSFANLIQHGVIKNNQIESKGDITPLKTLFETYKIPLKEDAFGNIVLDIDANKEKVQVNILVKGKEILQAEEGGFNVKTLYLENHLTYLISEGKLIVKSEGNVTNVVITVDIDHPKRKDLDVSLISPDGTVVDLSSDNGGNKDNLKVRFDDLAGILVQFSPALAGYPFRVLPKLRLGLKLTRRFKSRSGIRDNLGNGWYDRYYGLGYHR